MNSMIDFTFIFIYNYFIVIFMETVFCSVLINVQIYEGNMLQKWKNEFYIETML